jgi:Ran GTPase-activating protein (RanGAP) involved in mRNA processing and transport
MDTASLVAQLQLNQITSLKISKNEQLVEFGGIEGLLNLLRHNSSVTRLDLSGLYIGAEGAKAVAEAIKLNSTLHTINLWYNSIGDEGAKAVAEALKVNSTLQTIDLVGNSIGDEGAKAVAEALTLNSTLQTIGLGKNIGEDLKAQIAETLREIRARKEMNYRKLICAFTACQVDSACLRFDKMMLRYVYYPILGASEKSFED